MEPTAEELAKYTPEQMTEYQTIDRQVMYDELLQLRADKVDLQRRVKRLNDEINFAPSTRTRDLVVLAISYLIMTGMYEVAVMKWNLEPLSYMTGFMMFGILFMVQIAIRWVWVLVKAIREEWR